MNLQIRPNFTPQVSVQTHKNNRQNPISFGQKWELMNDIFEGLVKETMEPETIKQYLNLQNMLISLRTKYIDALEKLNIKVPQPDLSFIYKYGEHEMKFNPIPHLEGIISNTGDECHTCYTMNPKEQLIKGNKSFVEKGNIESLNEEVMKHFEIIQKRLTELLSK